MKQLILLVTAFLLCAAAIEASPRKTMTRQEVQALIRDGKARKAPMTFRQQEASPFFTTQQAGSFFIRNNAAVSSSRTPVVKPPMKITSGGSSIYGWQASSQAPGFYPGLYELLPEGYELKWKDSKFKELDETTLKTGWLHNGKICGYAYDLYYGFVYGAYYEEIDFETGHVLKCEELDIDTSPNYTVCSYRAKDGTAYGYGLCDETHNYCWMKVDPANPGKYTRINDITNDDLCYAMCYNPLDDTFYGITIRQKFVKINLDGTQEELFKINLDDLAYYISGLVFSPVENKFYWNANYKSTNLSALVKLSLDGEVEVYEPLHYGEEFNILFTDDDNVNTTSPERPLLISTVFENGSTDGYNLYQLPSKRIDGEPLQGKLTAVATIDDKPYKEYPNLEPGSQLKVEYTGIEDGRHYFNLYVTADGENSGGAPNVLFVGFDTPMAPTNVVLDGDHLSWSPVTEGVNNGYLDLSKMIYVIYVDDVEVARTDKTEITVPLPTDQPQHKVCAKVIALCNGKASEPALSNRVLAGQPYTVPVTIVPTAEQVDLCQVVDANNDHKGWYYSAVDKQFVCSYTSVGEGDVDDWVFMPAIAFDDTETYYLLTYQAGLFTDSFLEESIEICIGKKPTVEAMTQTIVEEFCILDWDRDYEALFKVPEAGAYYIGIHCTSKEDQFGLWVKNLRIENQGIGSKSPGKVTDVEAVPAVNGVLEATVSFTLPTETVFGEPLGEDCVLTADIEAARSIMVTGKPGERITETVTTVQGVNNIAITVDNEGYPGMRVIVDVYTGVQVPASVENMEFVAAPDMRSMVVTWTGPTEGEDGGFIVPEDVTYNIYKAVPTSSGTYDLQLIDRTSKTTYTYNAPEEQEYVTIGVASVNVAGISNRVNGVSAILGAPYSLPMADDFDDPDGDYAQNPWLIYSDNYDAYWTIGSWHDVNSAFESRSNFAIIADVRYDAGTGRIGMPRFTTAQDSEVTFAIYAYDAPDAGSIKLMGECYGMESPIEIGAITPTSETPAFTRYEFKLPAELLGKDWVQVYIDAELPDPMHIVAFDDFEIVGKQSGMTTIGADGSSVHAGSGFITVKGCEGKQVVVSAINGMVLFDGSVADSRTFSLERGVYVVKIGTRVVKVAVR